MGRDLHPRARLAHPIPKHFKLLPELLVAQYLLIQALRLLVKHVAQLLYRPLKMCTLDLQRLEARCIIHSPAPCP
jgi:hypothetical protein